MAQPYRPALRRLTAPANPFESLESRYLLSTTTLDFNGGSGGRTVEKISPPCAS